MDGPDEGADIIDLGEAELVRLLTEAGLKADDIGRAEFQGAVAHLVEMFQRSPDHAMTMTVARRIGQPFSVVAETWTHADLLAELAWDLHLQLQSEEVCPVCGYDHDVLRDDRGHPLIDSPVKLERTTCWLDEQKRMVEGEMSEEERQAGVRWEVRRRRPGDRFLDRG